MGDGSYLLKNAYGGINLSVMELQITCLSISMADAVSLRFKTDLSFSQLSISVSETSNSHSYNCDD